MPKKKTEDKKSSQRRIYTADKTETPKPHRERIRGASDAMDLISETEDNIDNVIYSTRTISIDEILKAEAEQKKKRGGKK